MANTYIKQVNLGGTPYELLPKYIQDEQGNAKTYKDIADLIKAGVQLVVDTAGPDSAPATTASKDTMGKIYLVPSGAISGTHVEFITVEEEGPAYRWEKIGTTDTDLTDYVKKGTFTSSNEGAHTHTVTGKVAIPTVAKTTKMMSATATEAAVAVEGTAAAITSFGVHPTDSVMGADTTFNVSGGEATNTNIKATASGAAIAVDSTANAITGLGKATTAKAITALGTPTTADAVTSYAAPTSDSVMGADTTFNVSGGEATNTNIKATATGTALNTATQNVVKSYPGVSQHLASASVTGVAGETTVPSSVTVATPGEAASWGASVSETGVLSFSWTANTPTVVNVGEGVNVATKGEAKNFVTGLTEFGEGATVLTGLGVAETQAVLTSASVKTQPTITLAESMEAVSGSVSVTKSITSISVASAKDNNVDVLTGLGTPTTAKAITGFGAHTTADAVTAFAAPETTTVATSVKVTKQPTITLATGASEGVGVVSVTTGVSGVSVTSAANNNVDVLTGLGEAVTADVATGVKVTKQPTITLNPNADVGVTYVDSVTIGTGSADLTEGAAASAGAHTHTTDLR